MLSLVKTARTKLRRGKHDDSRANGRPAVQVDDILVGQTNAAGRNILTDGPRLIRAMDPIKCILVVLPQVKCAGSERVCETSRHARSALYFGHRPPQLRPAFDHFLRWIPIRPRAFSPNGGNAGPREPFPADSNPVANGLAAFLHEVKKVIGWIDYDRTGRFPCIIGDDGAYVGSIELI